MHSVVRVIPKCVRDIKKIEFLNMVLAKKFIYANAFKGEPKLSDFKLVEEELNELQNGEILIEATDLSVDPYMRPYMMAFPIGSQMIGGQVAK